MDLRCASLPPGRRMALNRSQTGAPDPSYGLVRINCPRSSV